MFTHIQNLVAVVEAAYYQTKMIPPAVVVRKLTNFVVRMLFQKLHQALRKLIDRIPCSAAVEC